MVPVAAGGGGGDSVILPLDDWVVVVLVAAVSTPEASVLAFDFWPLVVVVVDTNAAAAFLRVLEASESLRLSYVSEMPIFSIPLRMASALSVIMRKNRWDETKG